MNRKIPYDRGLIWITLGLLGFGVIMVFSASLVVSQELYGSSTSIFVRQLAAIGLGGILLLATMRIDYRVYGKRIVVFGALAACVVLLTLPFFGPPINGAYRWIDLGPMNFQPSELAKLVLVLLTAFFLVEQGGQVDGLRWATAWYCGLASLVMGLVLLEPDFGTAATMAIISATLLFVAGLKYRYFVASILLAAPLFYILVFSVPYRRSRVMAFLDSSVDPYGVGYQIRQSLIAVGSGGVAGMGFARGTQKLFFLPELHSDFIYALIGQELGLIGSLALLCLFGLFFWRGVRVALRADSLFGTFLGLGIVTMVVFQALLNISVVLSLLPTKGIPLPFVSAGGSSIMVTLAAVGILLNISRQARGRSLSSDWVLKLGSD